MQVGLGFRDTILVGSFLDKVIWKAKDFVELLERGTWRRLMFEV
jgi:hypothetical protein